ncbi:MAG: response regulator transcription factor [Bacteroidetes bacterium]|nr:MAG: response regulator transcription factor [Bacteroidota bacterium]
MNNFDNQRHIRLILADDHKVMREGLASLIVNDFNMEVIGQAETGREAIDLTIQLKPDLVLMDITMPDMNGIEATRYILEQLPEMKIIALSMHADKRFVMEVINAGASGYLLKHSAADELERAIKSVIRGHTYISPDVTGIVIKELRETKQNHEQPETVVLSVREREILQLVAEGKSTKDIAAILNVSASTVESHRNNVMSKLGLYSIAELTKYAIREGLTSLE